MTSKFHDFAIDVMQRPRDGRTIYVARCLHGNGCTWHTGELLTRARAVAAVRMHQLQKSTEDL